MAKYSATRTIGRGGFGIVEEVVDESEQRFARKTFSPAPYLTLSPDALAKLRQRFRREVLIQQELGGTEIMPVLASSLDGDLPWFVMPLADKTYGEQIRIDKSAGSVDIDAVADILNGLQFLHDLGYVHRDLNPNNILFHDGHWKLSDLGAVLPPTGQTVTLTEGTVIYTEPYCSPEQRNDFHKAQAAADVYSFGCILHDIFGVLPRTPYSRQTATGPIGLIIEKCTEINPSRRPSVKVLRGLVLEALVEVGGHCKVEDQQSEEWLKQLEGIDSWDDKTFDEFARFFANLNVDERAVGHELVWVYSLSTPFLTRLSAEALIRIVNRKDGVSAAIVEKYCNWVRSTAFLFHYSDSVCMRVCAIFDNGTPADKAVSYIALIELGESHNRWFVMREMLRRGSPNSVSDDLARRLSIEVKTEEVEQKFRRCVNEVKWSLEVLANDLAKLCK